MRITVTLTMVLFTACSGMDSKSRQRGATVIQTIRKFHRPESVAWSLDGRLLYVSNCGSRNFTNPKHVGMVVGDGSVSVVAIGKDGRTRGVPRNVVEGLNGPLGIAVLPKATKRYPRGTLLVNQGLALLTDAKGAYVTDPGELGTGILFVHAENGKILGRIELGMGSAVSTVLGHPVLLPNSIAFDKDGNLYVTDTAKGGNHLEPPIPAHPGVVRIPHASIDDPRSGGFTFLPVSGIPNGIAYNVTDDSIYIVTMGGQPHEGQAVLRVPANKFLGDGLEVVVGDVGTMDGICFTPAGTIVTSRFSGDLLAIRQGKASVIRLIPDTPFNAPADIRLRVQPDGSSILAVPEQARTEPVSGKQRVRLIRLPKGF